VLEQPHVVALHLAHVIEQRLGKRVTILEAGEAREAFHILALRRQAVGLVVGHHLQPVLDLA
jgi:hypothetical protein